MLGGTEYQTLNLVHALRDSGYFPVVLCYFEYDPRMVNYMKSEGAEVVLMSPDGKRPKGPWSTFITLWKGFKNALHTSKPDIIHVQYMAPGSLAIIIFKLLGARRIIATAHVPGHIYTRKWVPRLLSRYVCDLFLCVSQSSEQAFFEINPSLYNPQLHKQGRKHFTVYNCTDIPEKLLQKETIDSFTIGVVSRLSYEKGIDRLLFSMPKILSVFPKLTLLIIGDGSERETLVNISQELHIAHAITWAGLQPKEVLQDHYLQMDIVVIPSRFEGFVLTAIELMSYGIDFVASKVDALMEEIDNNSGILTDASDPVIFANAIIELLKNPVLRDQMSENGHNKVKATFAYNIYQKTIADIYGNILKRI